MPIPSKTGVVVCDHCDLPCKNEILAMTHTFLGNYGAPVTRKFCSRECCKEALFGEEILEAVEKASKDSVKDLIKMACPSCLRRWR